MDLFNRFYFSHIKESNENNAFVLIVSDGEIAFACLVGLFSTYMEGNYKMDMFLPGTTFSSFYTEYVVSLFSVKVETK